MSRRKVLEDNLLPGGTRCSLLETFHVSNRVLAASTNRPDSPAYHPIRQDCLESSFPCVRYRTLYETSTIDIEWSMSRKGKSTTRTLSQLWSYRGAGAETDKDWQKLTKQRVGVCMGLQKAASPIGRRQYRIVGWRGTEERKNNMYIPERCVGVTLPDNIDGVILDVTRRKRIKKGNWPCNICSCMEYHSAMVVLSTAQRPHQTFT